MTRNKKRQSGFTLIELLVVLSIIGMLASIIMIGTKNPRVRARDAKRVQDAQTLYKGLEMYFADYGQYPTWPCCATLSIGGKNWDDLMSLMSPYMGQFKTSGFYYVQYLSNMPGGPCVITTMSPSGNIRLNRESFVIIVLLEEPNSQLANWSSYTTPGVQGYFIANGNISAC